MPRKKMLLGRTDKLDLPELHLYDIDAKIDTGAYTSTIHCHQIEEVETNGETLLHFILLDPTHPSYNNKSFFVKEYREKHIKNSFGHAEKRFIIRTPVFIYDRLLTAEFSLSYRGALRYPILIGRKLLKKGFIVDVSQSDLSYINKQRKPGEPGIKYEIQTSEFER